MKGTGRRVRALVLCAGRGERLLPLTSRLAKPLLPVAGRSVALRTIRILHDAGCEVAVNLHHLADSLGPQLSAAAEELGIDLAFAVEPDLLGTLGAVANLFDFLAKGDDILLVNGDSLCRWPIREVLARHRRSGADVTLQLGPKAPDTRLGGGVEVDQRGLVVGLRGVRVGESSAAARTFQGLHVLSPAALQTLPSELPASDIIAGLYLPLLLAGGRIRGFGCRRPWHDLGTPRRYLAGTLDWGRTAGGRRRRRRFVAPGARISRAAVVECSVVETGSVLESGACVVQSAIMPFARVGAGARLVNTIVGPGVAVPAGAAVDGQLVTPGSWGRAPDGRSRERGDLVFTPLDPG